MNSPIHITQDGHVMELVLNDPENRNTINVPFMDALSQAVDEIERLEDARVVLMRAEGKGFSAGLDLKGIHHTIERFGENWRDNLFPLTEAWQAVMNKVEQCSLPVIALIHNYCIGGGMELALACDMRIVTEGTRLSLPEAQLGIVPDLGGTSRLTRLVGASRAKELIMTGRDMDLDNAEAWGLVNYVVSEDELLQKGRELAEELCLSAPLAVQYAKRVINDITDVSAGLRLEAWAQNALISSEDFEQGIQATLMKQSPNWKGK